MKAAFQIVNQDEVEGKMEIIMPISAWKKLRERLQGDAYGHLGDVRWAIRDLIQQVEETWVAQKEAK